MASNVNVLCPNGRRQIVKVSPNTRILEIIETVCQKQKFNADDHNLKHQRTVLDVQVPFRYSNVPNNAKLELVKSDVPRNRSGSTTVALQLFTGERLQHSFESSSSLWDILQHWDGQSSDRPSLTCPPSDSGTSVHPICIYMTEEVIGEEWLKATTLRGLGLMGGRAIIRLLHREVELPPPPKKVQPKKMPIADTPAHPSNQMDSSTTAQASASSDQSIDAQRGGQVAECHLPTSIESKPAPQLTENAPPTNELAQKTSSNVTAMDCTTSDNRDDSVMEVDVVETKSEQADSPAIECDNSLLKERTVAQDQSVRPKESHQPSTSKEEGISKEEKTEKVVKDIEKQEGMTLDEYARRRIQNLLEKEEEMVKSMEEALMDSMAQQSQGVMNHQPPRRREPKPPVHAFADFKFPEPKNTEETDKGKGKMKQDISSKPCERNQLVFSPDQDQIKFDQSSDVPDEFFDLTVDDVRKRLSDLRHQSADSGKQLETKAMREAQDKMKMKKYEKVVVRIHFPDRIILQGFFRPQETVEAVKEFVKSNLADKEQSFHLYTTPPKTVLKDMSETLFKAKLFPAAVVHFGSLVTRDHYLHEDALGDLASLLQAECVVAKTMNTGITRSISAESTSTSGSAASSSIEDRPSTSGDLGSSSSTQQKRQASPSNSAIGSTKVPKWFKMGKR
ncbi:tether containing UBX domain for GLUT4-like [Lytechinus pictus]|uniref:tether containing UBX domain for GLUT4-like n=1 Tax=Lytechinus pictus TaxID=7653 RepID=UPI0030B9C44D